MFEKEAGEYAEEYAKRNNPAEYGVRATYFTVLNSFKDGAKFGYNEGKEEMGEKLDKAKEMLEQFIKFSMFPLTTKKDIEDVQILLKSASQFCKE